MCTCVPVIDSGYHPNSLVTTVLCFMVRHDDGVHGACMVCVFCAVYVSSAPRTAQLRPGGLAIISHGYSQLVRQMVTITIISQSPPFPHFNCSAASTPASHHGAGAFSIALATFCRGHPAMRPSPVLMRIYLYDGLGEWENKVWSVQPIPACAAPGPFWFCSVERCRTSQ